jgi:DNA-binding transcriptional MerR regulator
MRIKQLEMRSGLTRDTLRFYERGGLVTPPRRSPNGYRDYDEHTLAELKFIAAAREVGFTLAEIKTAIPHLKAPPRECQALLEGLRARRQAVQEELDLHHRQLRRLDELIRRFGGAWRSPQSVRQEGATQSDARDASPFLPAESPSSPPSRRLSHAGRSS